MGECHNKIEQVDKIIVRMLIASTKKVEGMR